MRGNCPAYRLDPPRGDSCMTRMLPSVSTPTATARVQPDRAGIMLTVLLSAMSMIGPFSTDTMFPAFDAMGVALAASPVELQQLVSVYLVAFAGMSLFPGPLSDAIGRRPVVVWGLGLYALASVGCALSAS